MTVPSFRSLALAAALLAPSAAAQWVLETSTDGSTPSARHEAGGVAHDGLLYLMGGRGTRPVDRYDPVAGTWTNLGKPPLTFHHVQPVVHDDLIWVVCAFEGGYPNETPVPKVWTFDPALSVWAEGDTIPAARNRGAAGVVVYEDAIYVVGGNTQGHDGGAVPWLDRYDPSTGSWTSLADAPHARDHFMAVVVGHKLVVAGGRETEQPNPFLNTVAAVDVYDFTTGTWTSGPLPIPSERAGCMAMGYEEFVVVVGGETDAGAHAQTEAFDVTTGEWVTLPDLIDSRHSGGLACDGSDVYVMSGSGDKGGSPELDTTERLDVAGLLTTSPSNVLANGDFDDGLTGWVDAGDLTLVAHGAIAAPALELANGSMSRTVVADGEETYRVSGSYRVTGTSGAVEVQLEAFNAMAGSLETFVTPLDPAAAEFTSFAFDWTTPRNTVEVTVTFVAGGDRALVLDDLVVRDVPSVLSVLGVPANPWVLASSVEPELGATWSAAIDHTDFAPAATLDAFLLGFFPVNLPSGPGTLLVDPTVSFLFFVAPGTPLLLPLPVDNALIGLPFLLQGASVEPSKKTFTNVLAVTVQNN